MKVFTCETDKNVSAVMVNGQNVTARCFEASMDLGYAKCWNEHDFTNRVNTIDSKGNYVAREWARPGDKPSNGWRVETLRGNVQVLLSNHSQGASGSPELNRS